MHIVAHLYPRMNTRGHTSKYLAVVTEPWDYDYDDDNNISDYKDDDSIDNDDEEDDKDDDNDNDSDDRYQTMPVFLSC